MSQKWGLGNFEELDRFYAIKHQKQEIIERLFFGTPAKGYRDMLSRDLGWSPPKVYYYALNVEKNGEPKKTAITDYLDLETLDIKLSGKEPPSLSSTNANLLRAMSSDLYKPITNASLFEYLYLDQFYDPASATTRVQKVIDRFRTYTSDIQASLDIVPTDFGYQLSSKGDFHIRYTLKGLEGENSDILRLKEAFGTRTFIADDLAVIYGISKRSANRLLADPRIAEHIEKIGVGRSRKYKIK